MTSVLCVLATVAVLQASAASINEIPKIVGGSLAEDGQYPYQASLRYKNRHFCGGSVLNKRWILTAAHCLSSFNDTGIAVVLGTNILDDGGDEYQSERVIAHPRYSSALIRNDIGLIKLSKDIVFGDKVKPVSLPNENFGKIDYPAVLSGWGTTSVSTIPRALHLQPLAFLLYLTCARVCVCVFMHPWLNSNANHTLDHVKYPGETPNELHHIQLSVIDQRECLNASFRVTNDNICTLNKRGEGACHGDSGGPLVADNEQIGVVSWGIPCARGRPDVFTRVYSYNEWINKYIQDESR